MEPIVVVRWWRGCNHFKPKPHDSDSVWIQIASVCMINCKVGQPFCQLPFHSSPMQCKGAQIRRASVGIHRAMACLGMSPGKHGANKWSIVPELVANHTGHGWLRSYRPSVHSRRTTRNCESRPTTTSDVWKRGIKIDDQRIIAINHGGDLFGAVTRFVITSKHTTQSPSNLGSGVWLHCKARCLQIQKLVPFHVYESEQFYLFPTIHRETKMIY